MHRNDRTLFSKIDFHENNALPLDIFPESVMIKRQPYAAGNPGGWERGGCVEFFIRNYILALDFFYYMIGAGILVAICLFCRGFEPGRRVCLAALIAYLFLVFSSTVLDRPIVSQNLQLTPFWSYRWIFLYHDRLLLTEVLLNVVMMVPVGLLLPGIWRQIRPGRVALTAVIMELCIETPQFLFRRGLAEWDDVFHGMVGSVLGYGLWHGARLALGRLRRWKKLGRNE